MNIIFFDIETISTFSKEWRNPPRTVKYEDPKEQKKEDERIFEENKKFILLQDKYWDKLNFMPEYNRVLCISIWFKNTDWWISSRTYRWDEKEIIKKFFEAIKWRSICWFNIKGFDNPFILKRALKHWIDIPWALKMFWKKPWEMDHIIDLQEVYKSGVFSSFSNLDLVCNHLWITSPKDEWIDWSQVQEFYDKWKEKDIILYCERDVRATIEVYNYFRQYNLI